MGRARFFLLTLTFLALATVALVAPARAVVPTFKNDLSKDEPGSVIEITEVRGKYLSQIPRILIYPGAEKRISLRNVYQFTVTRVFPNRKELFMIECSTDERVREKVIFTYEMVNTGKLPGDCIILKRGEWTPERGRQWSYVGRSNMQLKKDSKPSEN